MLGFSLGLFAMAIYEIYLSKAAKAKVEKGVAPDLSSLRHLKVVRDSKSIWALAFPLFWLIYHKLWFECAIYVCISIGLALFISTPTGQLLAILNIFPGLFLFLEGSNLVSAKLRHNGWEEVDVFEANNAEDATLKFLSKFDQVFVPSRVPSQKTNLIPRQVGTETEIGLFAEG